MLPDMLKRDRERWGMSVGPGPDLGAIPSAVRLGLDRRGERRVGASDPIDTLLRDPQEPRDSSRRAGVHDGEECPSPPRLLIPPPEPPGPRPNDPFDWASVRTSCWPRWRSQDVPVVKQLATCLALTGSFLLAAIGAVRSEPSAQTTPYRRAPRL